MPNKKASYTYKTHVCLHCKKRKPTTEFYRQRGPYLKSECKKCSSAVCVAWQRKRRTGPFAYKQLLAERAADIRCRRSVSGKRPYRDGVRKRIKVMRGLREHLISLWEKQKGRCFYTHREMQVGGYHAGVRTAMTIDRKTPSKGYVAGNLVLCCSSVNRMKQEFTLKELLALCEELLAVNRHKKGC